MMGGNGPLVCLGHHQSVVIKDGYRCLTYIMFLSQDVLMSDHTSCFKITVGEIPSGIGI